MWQKMTHSRLSSRNTLPAKGRPLQAKGKRFANSSVSIVDKKSTKGTVTLMAANFALLIVPTMKSSTDSPMTKNLTSEGG